MKCGTPYIWQHSNDPKFCIAMEYGQPDGSTIVEYLYPCDGRREIRRFAATDPDHRPG